MTFYSILKELHAYNRYFVLAALVFVLFRKSYIYVKMPL